MQAVTLTQEQKDRVKEILDRDENTSFVVHGSGDSRYLSFYVDGTRLEERIAIPEEEQAQKQGNGNTTPEYEEYYRQVREKQYNGGFMDRDFASDSRGVLYPPRPAPEPSRICIPIETSRRY